MSVLMRRTYGQVNHVLDREPASGTNGVSRCGLVSGWWFPAEDSFVTCLRCRPVSLVVETPGPPTDERTCQVCDVDAPAVLEVHHLDSGETWDVCEDEGCATTIVAEMIARGKR